MSDEEDYNSEEDEDYVPTEGDQVSEEENSGDEEDLSLLLDGDGSPQKTVSRKRPAGKKKDLIGARKRKGGIKLDLEAGGSTEAAGSEEKDVTEEEAQRRKELAEQIAKEEADRKVEKEKKRANDLWASFMSDVKTPPAKPSTTGSGLGAMATQVKPTFENKASSSSKAEAEKAEKVTITTVFDFAGEEVKITKEVDANSKEAKAEQKKQEEQKKETEQQSHKVPTTSLSGPSLGIVTGGKRPAQGGLSSVLNKIGKKNKMGTLDKSKIDWDSFKRKEGIEEDLKIHNKGKQGYTERMAFLNRADQRQYELERDVRLGTNSKR